MLALFLVASFVLSVCAPVQWLAIKLKKGKCAYLFGLISGPISVFMFLAVFTHYHVNFHNYVFRQWLMHVIFGVLGLWFSINYQKRKPA